MGLSEPAIGVIRENCPHTPGVNEGLAVRLLLGSISHHM
jgi:hypothetical protein